MKLDGKWEVRDHVRINPQWGATELGAKFDQEIVHCSNLTLVMIYEGDSAEDEELLLLNEAIGALRDGVLSFGGKSGWGQGWVRLKQEPRCYVTDRRDTSQLAAWLYGRLPGASNSRPLGKETSAAGLAKAKPSCVPQQRQLQPWSWLRLELRLNFEGPMLTCGVDREAKRMRQRTPDDVYLVRADGQIALPGSAIRGPLLAHAGRIALSLNHGELAQRLRGIVNNKDNTGCKGLVRFGEAVAVNSPPEIWSDHVAIDRITNFAVDQKLFNTRALQSPSFDTQLQAFWHAGEQLDEAAVALLLFTLRDACQELLWLGSRTTRGYGFLKSMQILHGKVSRVEQFKRDSIESADLKVLAEFARVMESWKPICVQIPSKTSGAPA
jgi:CRISPR/Cas system CSM-associated protein Csm3 (group 7 of RAMP superfamily)